MRTSESTRGATGRCDGLLYQKREEIPARTPSALSLTTSTVSRCASPMPTASFSIWLDASRQDASKSWSSCSRITRGLEVFAAARASVPPVIWARMVVCAFAWHAVASASMATSSSSSSRLSMSLKRVSFHGFASRMMAPAGRGGNASSCADVFSKVKTAP